MNEKTSEKMLVLVTSDDLNKVLTAFLIAIEAGKKEMEVSMFFMSCSIKALKKGSKLWLKGILMPFTFIAIKKMQTVGIGKLSDQIITAKELGTKLYACRACTEMLKLNNSNMIADVEIADRSLYIDLLQESDHHIEIC